jgi:hypothetical protein
MGGIEHASPAMLVLLVVMLAPVIGYVNFFKRHKERKDVYVRRIPGIDAIDDSIGHAAENGRPLSFCTGLTDVGPVLYACLGVLHYVTKKTARLKNPLLVPQFSSQAMAIVEDVVRDGYRSANRTSLFDPQRIRFLSEEQFAFASGYIGMMHREKVGGAFLFGSFAAESLILAEVGQQIGAMQVAASVSPEQIAFFICTCDYTLIGEELFAASSYLSREPVQLGSLYGQDRAKLVFFIMIIMGVVWTTLISVFPFLDVMSLEQLLLGGW